MIVAFKSSDVRGTVHILSDTPTRTKMQLSLSAIHPDIDRRARGVHKLDGVIVAQKR